MSSSNTTTCHFLKQQQKTKGDIEGKKHTNKQKNISVYKK